MLPAEKSDVKLLWPKRPLRKPFPWATEPVRTIWQPRVLGAPAGVKVEVVVEGHDDIKKTYWQVDVTKDHEEVLRASGSVLWDSTGGERPAAQLAKARVEATVRGFFDPTTPVPEVEEKTVDQGDGYEYEALAVVGWEEPRAQVCPDDYFFIGHVVEGWYVDQTAALRVVGALLDTV